jgi:heat shock protein HslJ
MATKLRPVVIYGFIPLRWLRAAGLTACCLSTALMPGLIEFAAAQPPEPIPVPPSTATAAALTLENTYWKLLSLHGKAIEVVDKKREPYLILQAARQQLMGSSGCNRLLGSYQLEGEQLLFTRTAGAQMTCKQGMEQERAFIDTLATVTRWRIAGQQLELLDANGQVIALFEPRYL